MFNTSNVCTVIFARKESKKWLIGFHFHNNSPSRIRGMKPIFVWPRIWDSSKPTLKTIKNMFGIRNLFAKSVAVLRQGLKIFVSRISYRNVSEFLQFIGLRLVEPKRCKAYASERITVLFAAILLVSRMEYSNIPIEAKHLT